MNLPDFQQLRELYARHRQGLFTLALSITRQRERAEDAVHEAFVKLCAPRAQSADDDGPRDLVSYMFRMVRHAAIDQVRRYWPGGNRVVIAADQVDGGWRHSSADDGAEAEQAIFELPVDARQVASRGDAEAVDPAAQSISSEAAAFIAHSLSRLPDEQRETIVMRIYGGLTFEQIATVLAAPLSTVTTRYRRGLVRLRPCLEKLL